MEHTCISLLPQQMRTTTIGLISGVLATGASQGIVHAINQNETHLKRIVKIAGAVILNIGSQTLIKKLIAPQEYEIEFSLGTIFGSVASFYFIGRGIE